MSAPSARGAAADGVAACRARRDPAARREALLDAAVRVFAERGYRSATLDDVARAADVSKGAVYLHFRSKADLLLRAVERQHAWLMALGTEADVEDLPAPERLTRLYRALTAYTGEAGALLRLLVGVVSVESPALYRRWMGRGTASVEARAAAIVRDGQRRGEIRADVEPADVGRFLASSVLREILLAGPTDMPGKEEGKEDTERTAPERGPLRLLALLQPVHTGA